MDTRRFKVLKTWKYKHYQSQPTTAGSEMASQMFTGNNMSTEKKDDVTLKALKDSTSNGGAGKTWAEWQTFIAENHPGWEIFTHDDMIASSLNIERLSIGTGFDVEQDAGFESVPSYQHVSLTAVGHVGSRWGLS